MATVNKELKYNGTQKSFISIILERTLGNTLVQVALVIICVLWSLPTVGLFISSFRTENDINTSGWWTFLGGAGDVTFSQGITVIPPDTEDADLGRSTATAGNTVAVLNGRNTFSDQLPQTDVSSFLIESVAGRITLEDFNQVVTIPDVGEVEVFIDQIEATPIRRQVFEGDIIITSGELGTELPQTVAYQVVDADGNELETGEVEISDFNTDVGIGDEYGAIRLEVAEARADFTPASGFEDNFAIIDRVGTNLPADVNFQISPVDDNLVSGEAGNQVDVSAFGTLVINADGSYEAIPQSDFASAVNAGYTSEEENYTLTIYANSRLLSESPSGVPSAAIESYGITRVSNTTTVEAFDEPVTIAGVGDLVVTEDGEYEFTPAEGFGGVFQASVDVEDGQEGPFEVGYTIEGLEAVEGSVEIGLLEDDIEIEAYGEPIELDDGIGTLVVQENGDFEFTPGEDYPGTADDFEFEIPAEAGEELPFDAIYRYVPYGERLNLTVAFAFVDQNGELTVEPRGATTEIDASIEGDVTDLPFTINYTAIRTSGRLVNVEAGETTIVPGFGELTVNADSSYTMSPNDDFVGEIDYVYTVQNPFVTLDNYQFVLTEDQMDIAFLNSLTVSIPATIIPIAIAAFAAYAFAWMDFPGRQWLFITVVGLMVVPLQVAFIPLLEIYTDLQLNGSFVGLWLAHTGFGMPLAVFLLRNYIAGLPRELIESAAIDGASHFTIFLRLVLPLSVPALASFAIFQFLWVWNDLLVALVFLGDEPVVTSRLSEMVGSRGQDWFVLTAGAFISMTIPLIVFFSLQRYFVRGLLAGSVKGG
jgi:alpha-glucoside transport system permease protein